MSDVAEFLRGLANRIEAGDFPDASDVSVMLLINDKAGLLVVGPDMDGPLVAAAEHGAIRLRAVIYGLTADRVIH